MSKNRKEDTHRMGKHSGYDLLKDGRIKVAPVYEKEFMEAEIESRAVEDIIRATISQCTELQKGIEKRRSTLWDRIAYDYGFDVLNVSYSYHGGIITVTQKEKKP